jgi:hypothetical protein
MWKLWDDVKIIGSLILVAFFGFLFLLSVPLIIIFGISLALGFIGWILFTDKPLP